jgi:hypothetical protein
MKAGLVILLFALDAVQALGAPGEFVYLDSLIERAALTSKLLTAESSPPTLTFRFSDLRPSPTVRYGPSPGNLTSQQVTSGLTAPYISAHPHPPHLPMPPRYFLSTLTRIADFDRRPFSVQPLPKAE